jgi:hypothetical protein
VQSNAGKTGLVEWNSQVLRDLFFKILFFVAKGLVVKERKSDDSLGNRRFVLDESIFLEQMRVGEGSVIQEQLFVWLNVAERFQDQVRFIADLVVVRRGDHIGLAGVVKEVKERHQHEARVGITRVLVGLIVNDLVSRAHNVGGPEELFH